MSDAALEAWARRLSEAGRLTPDARVLDIGGAPGALAAALHEASGAACTVVDPRPISSWPGVCALSGEAESLPVEDGSFVAVLMSHVLHWVQDAPVAVSEAARALRPGGVLLVRMAGHDDLRALPYARWIPRTLEASLAAAPDVPDVCAWLRDAGLEVDRVVTVETPDQGTRDDLADSVAQHAWREWALRGEASPDPSDEARRWALEQYAEVPPVRETLIVARRPGAAPSWQGRRGADNNQERQWNELS